MTNIEYSTLRQQIDAAAVRLADAERCYVMHIGAGFNEDDAALLSDLSAAADALIAVADDALARRNIRLAVHACLSVSEARLPLRDDAADLIAAMAA